MATELDALLSSIRDCKTYDAVKNRLAIITEKKDAATDPDVVRALRDAQVYALVWGVLIVAFDKGAPIVAFDKARKALAAAKKANVDNDALEAAYTAYEAACTAYHEGQGAGNDLITSAIKSVTDDAAKAAPGKEGIDAIADAAAAEMASSDAYHYLASQSTIYSSEELGADPMREYYNKKRQIRNILSPVNTACAAYVNEYVTRAQVAAHLKQSLNRYLLVWRVKKSGGGNPLAVQGILESIDEKNGTFVLKCTTYKGRRDTVSFSDIGTIDTSRTGSGALSSAITPDWRNVDLGKWVRSDEYYKYKSA
ncbi:MULTISPECIES: hypothetical protein [unclassified Pseudomonas]|uniref:hypothetical protein n=1 Tax=unclassified Pseudomonas TaxID=196821 RepID=UPI000CD32AAE|nr:MULTISPECIES: hypothetical protein [unclassified Pseudomonas]POA29953.1 hypothetical protein C1887_17585 [Pseudomonas sp. GW456-R21]POA64204.1 hypothetical protein C1884_21935 [Pseudomonas sp. GW460-R15]